MRWRAVSDTSHLTHFLTFRESIVRWEPIDAQTTRVIWTLRYDRRWDIDEGESRRAAARATIEDEAAWRLWFNALPPSAAESAVRIEGDPSLVRPLLSARSVIV